MNKVWIVKEWQAPSFNDEGYYEIIGIYDNLEKAQSIVNDAQYKRSIYTAELNKLYEDGI